MNLIEHLQQVPDFRTQPRYPLWVILVVIIMGTMSGCTGYRSLEDFVKRHQKDLLEVMGLPHSRLPSYSTLRKAMIRINFKLFTQAFNDWASETFSVSAQEQIPVDGKSIKATVQDYDQPHQDFILAGFKVVPKRWIVERTFGWLLWSRRLNKDYEVLPRTAEAFVYLAMIRLMICRLADAT
jgi:hypothetical protein